MPFFRAGNGTNSWGHEQQEDVGQNQNRAPQGQTPQHNRSWHEGAEGTKDGHQGRRQALDPGGVNDRNRWPRF